MKLKLPHPAQSLRLEPEPRPWRPDYTPQHPQGVIVRASRTASGYIISVHEDDGTPQGGKLIDGPLSVSVAERHAVKLRNQMCEAMSEIYGSVKSYGELTVARRGEN